MEPYGGQLTTPPYAGDFENFRFERRDGVLLIRLHSNDGPFVFSETAHHDFARVFATISADDQNRVVILTGTGDRFCADFDHGSFYRLLEPEPHEGWTRVQADGERMLTSFLDINVPVIAAINGPVFAHSELPVLADIVLAADTTVFRDATHVLAGIPPGDGMHVVWTTLLGLNRGRYFLLTGQKLTAREALALGVVAEVLEPRLLLDRAWELATPLAQLPRTTLSGTPRVLTFEWRRLLNEQMHPGLAIEALPVVSRPRRAPDPLVRDLLA